MIIKCKNCDGALIYDVESAQMKCRHCGSHFDVSDIKLPSAKDEWMDCNVYVCTACGAELSITSEESATFCAYCGQPTIVFDRVSKMLKPKEIIPFSVTKEQAENSIRKYFAKGRFVPKEIKKFKAERITGIYVPYWLYDISYSDKQRFTKGENDPAQYRSGHCVFKNLSVDASSNFCNESSQKLEPFDMNAMTPFYEGYLSGFYADRYDEKSKKLEEFAIAKCKKLFDKKLDYDSYKPLTWSWSDYTNPKSKIESTKYALLPVWFLTLRYQDRPYTMLVNGQTGKLVGAVPTKGRKVVTNFILLSLLLPIVVIPLTYLLFHFTGSLDGGDDLMSSFIACAAYNVLVLILFQSGIATFKDFKAHISDTASAELEHYSKHRQKGDV